MKERSACSPQTFLSMAFDRVTPELKVGREECLADAPERFATALQQFVWGSGRRGGSEASWNTSETRVADSPTALDKVNVLLPLPSSHAIHVLRALRSVLDAARCCSCCPREDPVTEAGLFMLRLTRLMEQQTRTHVQNEVDSCLRETTSPACVSPLAQSSNALLDESSALSRGRRSSPRGIHTIHRRGRRYTLPDASSSYSPSPSSVLDVSALSDSKPEASTGESVSPTWRFHADLTLQLQQCMLRSMCLLDTALIDHSAEDGGLCGILTRPRAAEFQHIFVNAITETLVSARDKWRADVAFTSSTEAVREVSVVLERLQQVAHAQRQANASPQLQVCELTTTEPTRRSPPPFASWRRSDSSSQRGGEGDVKRESVDAYSASDHRSDIERCLGVVGSDYAAKLVAQQLWCAQRLLSQRFPSYAASWDHLERARFFVESTRSPTPTVPRNDSNERPTVFGASASMARSDATRPDSVPRHDGGTPPPCVITTQRKGERPSKAATPTSPPFRSLMYSEERTEEREEETKDGVAVSTLSPNHRPPAPLPRLLPVARCPLWENLLVSCGVSAGSAVAAIQQLMTEQESSPTREAQQHEQLESSYGNRYLQNAHLNHSRGKQTVAKRKKTFSIETEHRGENRSPLFPMERFHARSR
ncbi:hypothetical protein ABB37_04655 [Leptomonas pyrrhocoris]|uniref:Uncharacterized protein n=1 Tax=Leptomonas pyrrhocoris TaxID=157538 RepID=A0A0M9G1S1_LEPPY|nr:hypothetical protein ABB37_04655 [Leptomonas pyrrhocoris]KPA80416.1 hypothetical protein ABB37_04655 [Leptomonas pyrrhocoris]|eukprot:XP_015658855.1 hypothetical protein ABB37_04655 [Leptomonas pyrrhocoris]